MKQALPHQLVDPATRFERRVDRQPWRRPLRPAGALLLDPITNARIVDVHETVSERAIVSDQAPMHLESIHSPPPAPRRRIPSPTSAQLIPRAAIVSPLGFVARLVLILLARPRRPITCALHNPMPGDLGNLHGRAQQPEAHGPHKPEPYSVLIFRDASLEQPSSLHHQSRWGPANRTWRRRRSDLPRQGTHRQQPDPARPRPSTRRRRRWLAVAAQAVAGTASTEVMEAVNSRLHEGIKCVRVFLTDET